MRSRIVSGRSNVYDELLFYGLINPKCYDFISQESLLRAIGSGRIPMSVSMREL